MPCEHYKDALIEAAATGAGPQGELRVHLAACGSCRATLEQEQFLFTAIDSGLRTTTNAEVPVSLLPRVRARLNEAVAPWLRWMQPLIFASASVALAFLLFLVVRPHRHPSDDQARRVPVIPAPVTAAPHPRPENSLLPTQIASTGPTQLRSGKNSTLFHLAASSNPEVLVPPEEREAFARFVVALRGRGEVALALVTPAAQTRDEPLGIELLHINRIEVKPLEEQQTEASDGAQLKQ
jgi:hypothetical protein